MEIDIVLVASYVIAIIATLVLSAYFFREYLRKKLRASLAWGIGLLLYFFGVLGDLIVEMSGEVSMGKPGLFLALLITVVGMVMLYYGTSLLFFSPGSFFREKLTAILLLGLGAYSVYLIMTVPLEGFRETIAPLMQAPFTLIYFIIGYLFYRVSRRLPSGDPRRMTVSMVAVAWFLLVFNSLYRMLFLGFSGITDAVFEISLGVAWILILYGMALGKAAKT